MFDMFMVHNSTKVNIDLQKHHRLYVKTDWCIGVASTFQCNPTTSVISIRFTQKPSLCNTISHKTSKNAPVLTEDISLQIMKL